MRYLAFVATLMFVVVCSNLAQAAHFVLHGFAGGANDGEQPGGTLALSGSKLYGITNAGGPSNLGTVFKLNADATGFELLHTFSGGATDGANPRGGLTLVGSTLYGTTILGGSTNRGTVFKVNTDGTDYELLHSFTGGTTGGSRPNSPLTASGQSLYGTTGQDRTVYKLNTDGTGFQVLRSFDFVGVDGVSTPGDGLAIIGSTLYGSATCSCGIGAIFKLNTDGTGYQFLHSIPGVRNQGVFPVSGLTASGSSLYGTTITGGASDKGTVFKLNSDGTGFEFLHEFPGGMAGGEPRSALIVNESTLYGTTFVGGLHNRGTVFEVNADGTGFQQLHSFGIGPNGGLEPNDALTFSDHTLYGLNRDHVFAITLTDHVTGTIFDEPPLGASGYTPNAASDEIGFASQQSPTGGLNPLVGVTAVGTQRMLTHRSVHATTTFDAVDLTNWDHAEVSVDLQVGNTASETGDFAKVFSTNGSQSVVLLHLAGIDGVQDELDALAGSPFATFSARIPADWTSARLVIESSTNSSDGTEQFNFDNIEFRGLPATLPTPGDFNGDGVVNLADVASLVTNYGLASGATPTVGDLTGDGRVGLRDLIQLRALLETPSAPVPEPSTIALAIVVFLAGPIALRVTHDARRHRGGSMHDGRHSSRSFRPHLEPLEDRVVLATGAVVPDAAFALTSAALGGIGLVLPHDDGGFYFAESFTGDIDFDPGPGESWLASAGDRDTVIARYAADGALLWLRQIGGAGLDSPRGMAIDRDGDLYVKGNLGSTTAWFGDTVVTPDVPSLYFVKLNTSGNFSWIITPQGEQNNRSLAIDDSSEDRSEWSVYTVPLEPSPWLGGIPYYSKLSAQTGGILDELQVFIPDGPNDRYAMEDVFVDERGVITATGSFYWYFSADFIIQGTDVTRFSPTGELTWCAVFPGFGTQERRQVAVDARGNTYVEATFRGSVGFTQDPADDINSSGPGYNSYVSALDNAGAWRWTTVLRAPDLAAARIGLAVDGAGNVFTAGAFSGEAKFGDTQLASAGNADAYLAQLDPATGIVVGAWRAGGSARDHAGSVAVDGSKNVYTQLSIENSTADSPTGGTLDPGEYILKFRPAPTTLIPGDANGDGHVDRLDVAIIAANLGSLGNADLASGDLTGDQRVSLADVLVVQANLDYGLSNSPLADAAPSPSAAMARIRPTHMRRALSTSEDGPRPIAARRAALPNRDNAEAHSRALRASRLSERSVDRAIEGTEFWRHTNGVSLRARRSPGERTG